MNIKAIDQLSLKSVLHYDQDTGIFTWTSKTCKKVKVGSVAGCQNRKGYVVIGLNGGLHYAHRLAFIWMGFDSPDLVDHKDGCTSNNAWSNLRPASVQQNMANTKRSSSNTSGYKGVSWHKKANRWSAQIHINNSKKHIGLFDSPEDAHLAYLNYANTLHPEFARGQ